MENRLAFSISAKPDNLSRLAAVSIAFVRRKN
jgi:hypothetical protein